MKLFLTGTDTGTGKTYTAALLLRALTARGRKAAGFKPICCGGREDAEILHAAGSPEFELNDVNPVWLRAPAAPYTAALVEGRSIDLALIREKFVQLAESADDLIVEGVGGWRVPILRDFEVADLATEFALPVALVVANRLGALNHAMLTLESIRARGATVAGIFFNQPGGNADVATASNRAILEEIAGVPILADIFPGQEELEIDFEV
jgi:dethiobiotin synthetase